MKMTPQRRRVLEAIDADVWGSWRPTAREIAIYCNEERRASDWAHGKIFALSKAGLIEFAGYAHGHAMTWRVTDAGRAALADA